MKRSRMIILASTISLAVFLPHVAPAQAVGTLRGRVTGPTGEALPGAIVSAIGTPNVATARADGSYQLTLPSGRYGVQARLLGYAARRDSVTVSVGEVTTKNFRVERVTTSLESVAILGTRGEQR